MNGFLSDFWRDALQIVGLILALVPVGLTIAAKFGGRSALRGNSSVRGSPQRSFRPQLSENQALTFKLFLGSGLVTAVSSSVIPLIGSSSQGRETLQVLLGFPCFGGAILQFAALLSLVLQVLIERFPALELCFSDTAGGNALASGLSHLLLVVSVQVFDAATDRSLSWDVQLIRAYSLAGMACGGIRLLLGVGLAVEMAGEQIKRSRH